MANVSFYLTAILGQGVKSHSLQERNFLWNVLIVDHQVKKNHIYSLGQLERLYNAISDCHINKPGGLSVQPPPSPGKLAAQLKSPFGDYCFS